MIYDKTCGELLEEFAREHLSKNQYLKREELIAWFAKNYPLFKAASIMSDREKYTTNCRNRIHYNTTFKHDLLFRENDDWERLRLYKPGEDPSPIYPDKAEPKTNQIYDKTCGELLVDYCKQQLKGDVYCTRKEIAAWFEANYPKLKQSTVLTHIEKYTTNFQSRVHHDASQENDLLFREDDAWNRVRLYRPETDPTPIYENQEDTGSSGRFYDKTCGELLVEYINQRLKEGEYCTRKEILEWFEKNYPKLKRSTVYCHTEKYTTNCKNRIHYGGGKDHDLLVYENNDWNRVRRYRPGQDPTPIYIKGVGGLVLVVRGSTIEPIVGMTNPPRPNLVTPNKSFPALSSWEEQVQLVFAHIGRHGVIDEEELVRMLGSIRKARWFADELEQHSAKLPYTIKIEVTPGGLKRYLRQGEK